MDTLISRSTEARVAKNTPAMNRLVFVSSTSRDLPEEREAVRTACDELGLAVVDMKDFPATGAGATKASLTQLDRAGVFVGVFAHRYGYVEAGHDRSVTESEYDHAGERGLERLCFLLHPSVAWPEDRKEPGQGHRVAALKERITQRHVVRWFLNPHDLLHQVYRALEQWLRQQGEGRGPCTLPAPPADFVGREGDLADLERNLAGAAISGVQGQGGLGKTALALKLAERLARRCPDGQLYLDLRGGEGLPMPAVEAQAEVVRQLRGPAFPVAAAEADLRQQYHDALRGRRVLLVLDNAHSDEQVRPLLPAGAEAVVVVTARRRLGLPGLHAHDLDTLPVETARAFVRAIAPRLTDADADAVATACGRLPLAVRLAATALKKRPGLVAADYLRRLEARGRLTEMDPVRRAIAESDDQLPAGTRAVWPQLAVLAGAFEKDWPAAIWGLDEFAADDHLAALLDHCLLAWDAEARLYRLHDLVRDYAAGRLNPADRQAAEFRHGRYFRDHAAVAVDLLAGADSAGLALVRFERAWGDIAAAFDRAADRCETDPEAQRLCVAIASRWNRFLVLARPAALRVRWDALAARCAGLLGDREQEAEALCHLGNSYDLLGDMRQAIRCHEGHLAIARALRDRRGESVALGNLGLLHDHGGRSNEAVALYEEALGIARDLGHLADEGILLGLLATAHDHLGRSAEALGLAERSLALAREHGHRRDEATALGTLADIHDHLGRWQLAAECYERKRALARESGNRREEGGALVGLGLLYRNLGRPEAALDCFQQNLAIARELGDRRDIGASLNNLGLAYGDLGDHAAAIDAYEQNLAIMRDVNDKRGEAYTLNNLGTSWFELGQPDRALEYFRQLLDIADEIGDLHGRRSALLNLGVVHAKLRETDQAIASYEQSLALAREVGDREGEGMASWNLGLLLASLGRLADAIAHQQVYVDFLRSVDHPDADRRAASIDALWLQIGSAPHGPSSGEIPS